MCNVYLTENISERWLEDIHPLTAGAAYIQDFIF